MGMLWGAPQDSPASLCPATPPQPPGGPFTTSLISLRSPGRAPALTEPGPLRLPIEVGAFYWTVLVPDIVNPGRDEQCSGSV
jgi:hypothetical protein